MKQFLLLVALLTASAVKAQPVVPVGARVRIDVKGRSPLVGQLVQVNHDSASVRACAACGTDAIARSMIRQVAVSRGREQSANRTLVLSLLGAGAGVVLAVRLGQCTDGPCPGALLAIPAAIAGSVTGTLIGLHIKSDRWESARLP